MKINMLQTFKDFSGEEIKVKEGSKLNITLRKVCCDALGAIFQDEQNLSGEEKYKRGILAYKLIQEDTPDLSIEEIALLKMLIGKMYSSVIVKPVWDMLEGKL